MLRRLTVENYALIDKLDIELDSALNIITGETGAGKSILLGALGLLLGNKNESGSLRDESRNCIIEVMLLKEALQRVAFQLKDSFDYAITRLISQRARLILVTKQQAQRSKQNRLTSSRLTRNDIEMRIELQIELIDKCIIFNCQTA